jgi:hypothetical protein
MRWMQLRLRGAVHAPPKAVNSAALAGLLLGKTSPNSLYGLSGLLLRAEPEQRLS